MYMCVCVCVCVYTITSFASFDFLVLMKPWKRVEWYITMWNAHNPHIRFCAFRTALVVFIYITYKYFAVGLVTVHVDSA
jgi:hypothetical protein